MRKMQRRFILAAMISFATVMLILAVGINVANYHQVRVRQDDMLNGICEYERMKASHPERRRPPISDMPWARGPEAEFTIRFFAVHCDMSGKIVLVTRDHISSVDENTAREYTEKILSKGRERGYHEDYRYLVKPDQDGISVVFLNIFEDIQAGRSLLAATVIIGIASLLAVFVLVVVFSGRAIRPYIRNIERQKRFITDAGHELKTPLTSIATSADIAAMEHGDDEWIANIRKQSARLAKLVGELVTLSRLDEEEPLPEKALFSLSDAAWEIAEPFSVRAKAEGKSCSQQIEDHLELTGDRNMIQRMLSILLDNALRYSGPGGEIRMDIYGKRGRIYMEVSNTCGQQEIPDLERLFDRFYRPDDSRSSHTGVFGIGLSIARAVAQAHGGKITAQKREEGRILFRVVI